MHWREERCAVGLLSFRVASPFPGCMRFHACACISASLPEHPLLRHAALNAYLPKPKVTDGVNLLSGKNDDGNEATQVRLAVACLK